jgi:hypothetical protein
MWIVGTEAPQISAGRRKAKRREASCANVLRSIKNAAVLWKTLANASVRKNHSRGDTGEWRQPFGVGKSKPRGARYYLDLVIDESAARTFQISTGLG